jgi:hypothetical protein
MLGQLIQLLYFICVQLVSCVTLLLLGGLAIGETPGAEPLAVIVAQSEESATGLFREPDESSPHFEPLRSVVGFKGRTWTEGV